MEAPRRGLRLAAPLVLLFGAGIVVLLLDAIEGPRAPDTRFALLGSEPVGMNSLLGDPLLVNFWATTCSICREEMPKLAKLYRELHPRGLEIIGVAMPYDPPNLVADYVERVSIPYPVSLDVDAEIVDAFGDVTVTPTTFLISPDGFVVRRYVGRLDFATLRVQIHALLPPAHIETPGGQPAAGTRIVMRNLP